jgi:hypothetical protein
MKNHALAVLRSVSLVGVLSCAVICPVYAQGVREIGSNTPVNSDSPVVKATNAAIQLSIRITEPATTVSMRTLLASPRTLLLRLIVPMSSTPSRSVVFTFSPSKSVPPHYQALA